MRALNRHRVTLLATLSALPGWAAAQPVPTFEETWRPGYHFSPAIYWQNEPNGMVYKDGLYHVFYQHNPYNNQWGNMSWGHATSPDMVHWTHQPVALPGEGSVMSFSGSAVDDANNTSGLGSGGDGPLIAAYTGWTYVTGRQDQRLAYSNDGGMTWTKYAGNPVLDIGSNEIRDPKVFWHAPTSRWIMVLSHGGQNRLTFWASANLKTWVQVGQFTNAGVPGSITGWEVPDLFELPVDGNPADTRWVLSWTPANGSPAGGNGVCYLVGDFNGSAFIPETPVASPLWADYGRDWDGQQSWANAPDGRVVWTAIMNSYGGNVPTTPWRGNLGVPRNLALTSTPDGIRMLQTPIAELQQLRSGTVTAPPQPLVGAITVPLGSIPGDMIEIIAEFDPGTADTFGLVVRESSLEKTEVGYDALSNQLFMDRTDSGTTGFSADAGGIHYAPLDPDANGHVRMHVFVDRGSVEVFANDGLVAMSNLIFPVTDGRGVRAYALGGVATLVSLEVHGLSSVWTTRPPADPGGPVVARWSMDPVPQNGAGHNPRAVDSRVAPGEGTLIGGSSPYYEPDAGADNLWYDSGLSGGAMISNASVPPASMFANGFDGGTRSYNAAAIGSVDGALFFPADIYGNEFSFNDAFTLELFFRTSGDQSGAGLMQLLMQGETRFRFGLIVNEGGAGNVRFAIHDGAGTIPIVDISSVSARNYADGQWHYLLAEYDPSRGSNGELCLTIANEDGSSDTATTPIGAGFAGLPFGGDGNLLIGREDFDLVGGGNGTPRTFLGLIDEVQLTDGLVPDEDRLGLPLPSCGPADLDANGQLNLDDLDLFIAWFLGGNLGADLTGDGVLNLDDLDAFVAAFLAGCA